MVGTYNFVDSVPIEAVRKAIRMANTFGLNDAEVIDMTWNPPKDGASDPNGTWTVTFRDSD